MSFLRRSEREWANNSVVEPALSDGAAQVLAVIGRAYVVVDEVGGVAQASPGAYAMGLVRGHTVVSEQLSEMTAPKFRVCSVCAMILWPTFHMS